MQKSELELPELLLLTDYKGVFEDYIEAVYSVFKADFIDAKPSFRGQKLKLKKHPYVDGKEYTFYHLTHKGKIEHKRLPDLRRCERIGWAKPTIEQCDSWNLKVWPQKRTNKKGPADRICIWLELEDDLDYVIILDVRENYILPWTAFVLEYNHEKRKKQKEYEEYIKNKGR